MRIIDSTRHGLPKTAVCFDDGAAGPLLDRRLSNIADTFELARVPAHAGEAAAWERLRQYLLAYAL